MSRGRLWQRTFAIVGIVSAFVFLVIVPGFFAIRTYGRWQNGERDTPTLLLAWGLVSSPMLLYLAAIVVAGVFFGPVEM
jgi:hypothetical protein